MKNKRVEKIKKNKNKTKQRKHIFEEEFNRLTYYSFLESHNVK